MTLVWLALTSILWGAVLVAVGTLFQRLSRASGVERQMLWRCLAVLLVLPWLAAPFVEMIPRPDFALPELTPDLPSAAGLSVTITVPPIGAAIFSAPQAPASWLVMSLAVLIAGWAWRLIAARRAAQALHHILARSQLAVKGPALAAVRVWSQQLGLKRRPDLRLTETAISPFSFGVRKPVICLPDGLEGQLSAPALDLVVGHECLHVARGDGWRRPLERSFADVLWFNPFAWRMRRELDLARELACDEAVLDRTSVPGDYARVLRDVAGLASGLDAGAPAASMSLTGGGRVLSMRVRRALSHANRKPGRAVMAGALLLALAGAPVAIGQAVLINPLAAPPSAIAPPAPPATPRANDGLAPAAPLAAPTAPALPALSPPPAPPYEARVYVSSDGLVRASFPARVTAISGDAAHGFRIDLLEDSKTAAVSACASRIEGLISLMAANGQLLSRGEAIGERGKLDHFSVSTRCSGQRDGQGRPIFYAPPATPAPPAAPAPLLAPLAPAAPAPLVRPSPPAPLVPNLAPLAPSLAPNPINPLHALIRAPFDATITKVASSDELGLYVVIDQIDTPQGFGGASAHGCMVKAPHLSMASVKQGQSIRAGGVIGERVNGDGNITAECKSFNADQITGPTTPAPADGPSPSVAMVGANRPVLDQPAHLSSPFGFRVDPFTKMTAWHEGVDLAGALGSAVHSPVAGKVTFAGKKPNFAYVVEISAPDGYVLRFAHLGALSVKEGDLATAGASIGTIGMDDASTGPHVHVEVFWKGKGVDPEQVKGLTLIAAN